MSTIINQKADKRTRLIEAADELFHQQGVSITTLANIAALAEVPLGNVYYYFKSKESIILTVIEQRRKAIQQLFSAWNTSFSTPKARLKAFIEEQSLNLHAETMAYGDALGSLCQELGKQGGEISLAAAALMKEVLNFCETQFKAINPELAEVWALHLVSSLQGINLLTLTFKEASWLEKQNNTLMNWLESL